MTRLHFLLFLFMAIPAVAFAQSPDAHHHHDFGNVDWAVKAFEDPQRAKWQKPDEVVAALHLARGAVVADIGASTGYFSRRLARAVGPTGRVLALDIEPALIEYMKQRARVDKQPNIEPRLVKPDDPALPAHGVDLVLIVDTLHHIAHRDAYYGKIKAGLKAGGRLAIVDFNDRSPIGPKASERLSPALVRGELERNGFRVVEQPSFLPYQYFIIATPR